MSDFFDSVLPHLTSEAAQHRTTQEIKDQYNTSPLTQTHYRGDRGIIVKVDPDTYTYEISTDRHGTGGSVDLKKVGRLIQDTGDKNLLPVGTQVAISYDYGYPLIAGILPFTTGKELNDHSTRITGVSGVGGDDPRYADRGKANFRTPGTPRDLGPGDWAQVGSLGNFLAMLEGGVSMMGGGPHSQIRTYMLNDLVEVICRNYRHYTDFGVSEIKNDNGRMSWTFRGGSDQLTESGSDQENWTIRVDLGAEGDLFHFELTQPSGGTLFKFHVNADGQLELFCDAGTRIYSGRNHTEKILQHREIDIKGNDIQIVKNNQTKTINGNRVSNISLNDTDTIGNNSTLSIMNHRTETIGGVHEEKVVGGNIALMKPGDVARETTINGTWNVDIGNPLAGANPVALPSYHLTTYTGDISQEVMVKGDITRDTLLGDIKDNTMKGNVNMETVMGDAKFKTSMGDAILSGSKVHLGADSADEPFVCGNLWKTVMGELLDALMKLTVPTPVGPSAVPVNMADFIKIKASIAAGTQLSTFIKGKNSGYQDSKMPLQVAMLQAGLTAGLPAGLTGAPRSAQALVIALAYDAYAKLGVSCAMLPPSLVMLPDLQNGLKETMEKDNSPLEAAQGWAAAFEKYWTGAMFGGTGMVTVIGGTKALEAQLTATFANPMNTLPIFITQVTTALDTFTKTVIVNETLLPGPPAPPCGPKPIS